MIFTGYSLLSYLVENGIHPDEDILSLFVKEEAINSRNYTYSIGKITEKGFEPEWFIKQSKNFDPLNLLALNTESKVYDTFSTSDKLTIFHASKIYFDQSKNLLILKTIKGKGQVDFYTYTKEGSLEKAQKLSKTLAELHSALLNIEATNSHFLLYKPSIFSISIEALKNVEHVRILNAELRISNKLLSRDTVNILIEIHSHLPSINFDQDTIIHNDIRPENFLEDKGEYKLIDWESACWGDKYWDLACLFDMFLKKTSTLKWQEYTKKALKTIWEDYHTVRGLEPTNDNLKKTIQFVGLKRLDSQLKDDSFKLLPETAHLIISPATAVYKSINIWDSIIN